MDKNNAVILKVGSTTLPHATSTSICGHLVSGKTVFVDVMGAVPNYICTKALILVTAQLAMKGLKPIFSPYYSEVVTPESETKTAVRWKVQLSN